MIAVASSSEIMSAASAFSQQLIFWSVATTWKLIKLMIFSQILLCKTTWIPLFITYPVQIHLLDAVAGLLQPEYYDASSVPPNEGRSGTTNNSGIHQFATLGITKRRVTAVTESCRETHMSPYEPSVPLVYMTGGGESALVVLSVRGWCVVHKRKTQCSSHIIVKDESVH